MAWNVGWEYEMLFDVEDMGHMTPLEQMAEMEGGDRWKTEKSGLRKGSMGYRTRTTKAGPRLEAEIFPMFGKEQENGARQAKKNLTPEKIQKYNDEKARRRLVQLMDANFGAGDLSLGLTYEGDEPSWKQVCKDIKNYIKRIRRMRKKMGLPELKYIYAVEDRDGQGAKRIHAHLITQGDMDAEELKAMWRRTRTGGFCNIDTLQPNKHGLEDIARYIYNQNPGTTRERGKRKYSCSRNLKKPQTRTSDTKVTGRRVRKMSQVFSTEPTEARRIMETLYPGYEFIEGSAKGSDIITEGVYIRVLMRKRGA